MTGPRLLLFGTDQWGPGTICGGIRIAIGAVRRVNGLCVLAVTDTAGIGALTQTERFDHIRLNRAGPSPTSVRLRQRLIREIVRSYDPDIVVALRCSAGPDGELLATLAEERVRRPHLRTALALWDVPTESELEVLGSQSDRYHDLFDEVWSFGDPSVYNRRRDLPPTLGEDLVDLGYATHQWRPAGPAAPADRRSPTIAIDLGSGWLTSAAVEALRAGLSQRHLRRAKVELLSNPVLGRKRVRELASTLGVAVGAYGEFGPDEPDVLVTTGGYNSTCAALSAGHAPLIVHDARSPSVRRRAEALAEHGACSSVDLSISDPPTVADAILRRLDERSTRPTVSVDGITSAGHRIATLVAPDTSRCVEAA